MKKWATASILCQVTGVIGYSPSDAWRGTIILMDDKERQRLTANIAQMRSSIADWEYMLRTADKKQTEKLQNEIKNTKSEIADLEGKL